MYFSKRYFKTLNDIFQLNDNDILKEFVDMFDSTDYIKDLYLILTRDFSENLHKEVVSPACNSKNTEFDITSCILFTKMYQYLLKTAEYAELLRKCEEKFPRFTEDLVIDVCKRQNYELLFKEIYTDECDYLRFGPEIMNFLININNSKEKVLQNLKTLGENYTNDDTTENALRFFSKVYTDLVEIIM